MRSTCLIFVAAFLLTTIAATEIDIALHGGPAEVHRDCDATLVRGIAFGIALLVLGPAIPAYLLLEWWRTRWKQRLSLTAWVAAGLIGALWPILVVTGILNPLTLFRCRTPIEYLAHLPAGLAVGALSGAASLGVGRVCRGATGP